MPKKLKSKKSIISLIVCLLLIFTLLATTAMATETYGSCTHHEHDEDCGGMLNNCTYICEPCVAKVQALIDKLPEPQDITDENADRVKEQLEEIHKAQIDLGLSDAAIMSMDFSKYADASFILSAPDNFVRIIISKISTAPTGVAIDVPTFEFINEAGEKADFICNGVSVSSVEVTPNGDCQYLLIPAGEYTVNEIVDGNWSASITVNDVKDEDLTFTVHAGKTYVMRVDNVYNNTPPVISGIINGETYYTTQKVTVTDENGNLASVKIGSDEISDYISYSESMAIFNLNGNVDETYVISAIDDSNASSEPYIVYMKSIASISDPIKDITADNVSAGDKDKIEAVKEQLEEVLADTEADDSAATDGEKLELKDDIENTEELLDKIDDIEKEVDDLISESDSFDESTVTSEDKDDIEDLINKIEDYLDNNDNLTDEQIQNLETAKEALEELNNTITYSFLNGNNSVWIKGSTENLTFTINGSYDNFAGIKVDNNNVDASGYTSESGSTIVTLKASYLETLTIGEHELTVNYNDGEVKGAFTVKSAEGSGATPGGDDENGDDGTAPGGDDENGGNGTAIGNGNGTAEGDSASTTKDKEVSKTSDQTSLFTWIGIIALCSLAIAGLTVYKKKMNN